MTTDEALAFAHERGWTVLNMGQLSTGLWSARLMNSALARQRLNDPGFNDSITDYGQGATPADAIMRALRLRYDRQTGKLTEIEVSPLTPRQEEKIESALGAAIAVRQLTEADFIDEKTWTRLRVALEANIKARTGVRRR